MPSRQGLPTASKNVPATRLGVYSDSSSGDGGQAACSDTAALARAGFGGDKPGWRISLWIKESS